MIKTTTLNDYQLIDSGNYEKLERWNQYLLIRPEPTAIWPKNPNLYEWYQADAQYLRDSKGQGRWHFNRELPESWIFSYESLRLKIKPTDFKHTGIFPEQASNWEWLQKRIQSQNKPIKVLNLFAYTGVATLVCSQAGAFEVVHVDSSKSIVEWAKENRRLSQLDDHRIRYLVDDCLKFVLKEQKRGNLYQGILMDPPSYGRGPNNEVWKIEHHLETLIQESLKLLDLDHPLFFLVNTYSAHLSQHAMKNMMLRCFDGIPGTLDVSELGLSSSSDALVLPCGVSSRWFR